MFKARTTVLQERLAAASVSVALITDDDSVYYFTGFYDYLHMDFGRPTVLIVPSEGNPVLITPMMELEMARNMTWVEDIRPWLDGEGDEWRGDLGKVIGAAGRATPMS